MLTVVDGQNNELPETQTEAASTEVIEMNKSEETIMDNIMSALGNTNIDVGLEELAALLSLPDEQFTIISELVLDELDKSLNHPQDRILLQQSLIASGQSIDDLVQLQEELLAEIDTNLVDKLPQDRIDFLKRIMTTVLTAISEADGTAGNIVNIPIEVMAHGQLPTYAHDGDAAMDVYATEDLTVDPGQTVLVKTGLKVAIPRGYALLVQPRSGQSLKTKLRVANTPGLIDSGYRDEIGIIIENIESPIQDVIGNTKSGTLYGKPYVIEKGQRIAQLRLVEVPSINWVEVSNINEIEGDRGGGFGSSGK